MRRRTKDDLSLRSALRGLPQREPSSALERRIAATLAEHDAARAPVQPKAQSRNAAPMRFAGSAGFAIAASVAALVFLVTVVMPGRQDVRDEARQSAQVLRQMPGEPLSAEVIGDFSDLLAESARLERALVALPRRQGVVRVATAGTIAGLEDHIALIDAELSASAALEVGPTYQEVLWRERVEVMNALVDVHYAQLPARVLIH